jgi:hypothetical protein
MDSVNSNSDYFAYSCTGASETTLHQKIMLIADQSHLRRQTVETNCKNKPCQLDSAAERRAWISVVL